MTQPPLGEPLDWSPPPPPARVELRGAHVLARPLDADRDAGPLYEISHPPAGDPGIWTYLPDGPYDSVADFHADLTAAQESDDPLFFTLVAGGRPLGIASYLRIEPRHGVIEIGHIWFGPGLARTTAATEAIYLLAANAFDTLGYRRLEWKCNALNAPSRHAAERFGFTFEGVFRNHQVSKGRNRDTAWYAIVDRDWPPIRAGFQAWLAPQNFGPAGRQRQALSELIVAAGRA